MISPTLMQTYAKVLAAVVTFGALLALSSPARAHEFEPERQVLMQVFPDHVDLVITYIEAPGERTGLFDALFGLTFKNPPPQLQELAKRALLPRMLDGLTFEVQGERPIAGEPEMRLQRQQGRLMAAAFVRYDLSTLTEDQERTVFIRSRERAFLPTEVQIYSGGTLKRTDDQDERLMTVLDRDQELRATFSFAEGKD